MADSQLFLVVTLTGGDLSGGLVHDIAASALARVGYSSSAAAAILAELEAALGQDVVEKRRQRDVQFHVEAGSLVIAVSAPGRAEWRLTRPLPVKISP